MLGAPGRLQQKGRHSHLGGLRFRAEGLRGSGLRG